MDGRLNVRPAPDVLARIARRWLQGAAVPARLGSVTLAAHQIDAAERLLPVLHEYGGALLADSPGMGKTYVALAVGARLRPRSFPGASAHAAPARRDRIGCPAAGQVRGRATGRSPS